MRASWVTLTLCGCVGGANLGQEHVLRDATSDATTGVINHTLADASLPPSEGPDGGLAVEVSLLEPPATCGACFVLGATGLDATAAYDFRWDDGSTEPTRRVCPARDLPPYRITVTARSGEAAVATFDLSSLPDLCSADAGRPEDAGAPLALCVNNGGFEPTAPGIGSTFTGGFGAAPWLVCGTPPAFPQLVDTNMAALFMLPDPSEGQAYLGLGTTTQVSEALCTPIAAGTTFRFRVDLAHSSGAAPSDTSAPVLELWGGDSTTCSQDVLLWSSPSPLTSVWQSFCGTVTTQQPLTTITFGVNSSGGLPSPYDVLIDHLQAVTECPP